MDMGVQSKKKAQVMKPGLVKHPTSRVILSNQWDSVESDTESLAQEKAYRQQLQNSTKRTKHNLLGKDKTEGSRCENAETESGSETEFENLQINDSLEVVQWPHGWKTLPLSLADEVKSDARGPACKMVPGEDFSYLSKATEEEHSRGCRHILVIDATIPAVGTDSGQPFHLHPPNGQRGSVASADSQLQSQVTDLSGPSSVVNGNQSQETPQSERFEQRRKTSVANKQPQQVKDDIVTSNKISLGRITKNHGSYLRMHALKHDTPFKQVSQINREGREQPDLSSSLSQLPEENHVQESRVELIGCHSSSPPTFNGNATLYTSPLLFPVPQHHGFWSEQENGQLHEPYHRDLESNPKPRLTPISGSFKVLPPIEKPQSRGGFEQSPEQSVSAASDSYLVQMERKQQSKTRVSYKAYTLKDYKQLKSDIELRGLGPDYTNAEKTAEKMRRQKQYANAIREQNRNINRIPFIPTKEPNDNDQQVPRMKALEYAKTIAKPLVPQQPKKKQPQRQPGAQWPHGVIEGLNMSDFSRLEVLKKRHEEEKKAFALLRK